MFRRNLSLELKIMIVKLISNIPYLQHINGEHILKGEQKVISFLQSLGVNWDEDALVILNGSFSTGQELLRDNDKIELLIPLLGG